ncbi:ribonuclease III [Fervidicella metallireducens AeB]|uniref:Ribonuclease 3 n=1 Tax=Fervidicella metallireducens AeB TaxID=1403537 RepID=A0A017RZE4_9CLOT|nr:ribonuclease III [Fervidicella metallireducens]EYE89310.1 ribonuclease III [Fervidicella metallireducens AeB]
MNSERKKMLKDFQEKLGVHFNKLELLDVALTHSSYANQFNLTYNDHNERLEFLGDSVLSMIVSEYLYKKYKNKPEGKLTRIRAGVVCESSLAEISRRLGVNRYLRIGKGEELSGGREKDSLLADACEAIIAAVYLDRGFEKARDFVLKNLEQKIELFSESKNYNDFKSKLQEYVQKNLAAAIKYNISGEFGPDHDKTFEIEVYLDNKCYGRGTGKSKKEAEQLAAKQALKVLGVEIND